MYQNTNITNFIKVFDPLCFTKVKQLRYISKRFELTTGTEAVPKWRGWELRLLPSKLGKVKILGIPSLDNKSSATVRLPRS